MKTNRSFLFAAALVAAALLSTSASVSAQSPKRPAFADDMQIELERIDSAMNVANGTTTPPFTAVEPRLFYFNSIDGFQLAENFDRIKTWTKSVEATHDILQWTQSHSFNKEGEFILIYTAWYRLKPGQKMAPVATPPAPATPAKQ